MIYYNLIIYNMDSPIVQITNFLISCGTIQNLSEYLNSYGAVLYYDEFEKVYIIQYNDVVYGHNLSDIQRSIRGLIFSCVSDALDSIPGQINLNNLKIVSITNKISYDIYNEHINPYELNINDDEYLYVTSLNDGVLLRFYYHNNKWLVATNNKVNAMYSTCNTNKSFYDLLNETININNVCETLDKNKTYLIMLYHPESSIVTYIQDKMLLFITSIDNNTGFEMCPSTNNDLNQLKRHEYIGNLTSFDLINQYVNNNFTYGIHIYIVDQNTHV